jgi:hypothetical protein
VKIYAAAVEALRKKEKRDERRMGGVTSDQYVLIMSIPH